MGTEITTPFGGAVTMKDRQELAKRAAASAEDGSRGGAPDGSQYMNFSGKRGMYTIGQAKRRIENDELWLLNVLSFEDGWVCWKGGKPAAQRMANIYGPGHPVTPPNEGENGPFDTNRGEGWFRAKAWVAKSLDNDEQGYFKINSVSGVGEMADMLKEVSQRMSVGQPCWPVFTYDCEEFEAQGYRNFKPVFKVYGWLGDEQVAELGRSPDADIDGLIAEAGSPTPSIENKNTEAKGSDPSPAPQEAAPTGGRRRRRSA